MDPELDVVNLGLDGTGTDVHVDLLREELGRLRPHVVLLAFYENDLADLEVGPLFRSEYRGFVLTYQDDAAVQTLRGVVDRQIERRGRRWMFERVYLWRAVTYVLLGGDNLYRSNFVKPSHAGLALGQAWEGRGGERLGEEIRDLRNLAREHGFVLLITAIPAKGDPGASQRILDQAVGSEGEEVVDLMPHLRQVLSEEGLSYGAMFWRYDGHLNDDGNRVLGKAAGRALADRL